MLIKFEMKNILKKISIYRYYTGKGYVFFFVLIFATYLNKNKRSCERSSRMIMNILHSLTFINVY